MKTLIKLHLIIPLTVFSISTFAQTCLLESEIPSSTPDSRFVNNFDGTISDNGSGLMWHRCQLGRVGDDCEFGNLNQYNWQEAFIQANNNSLANYSDWRLPNINELKSIIEQRCFDPAINATIFPNTANSIFWTSSPYTSNAAVTWSVGFSQGSSSVSNRNGDNYLRMVRTEQ